MSVTVKDIAKQANVSTATVSNVLTGKKYVSEELVKRVYDAINKLHYRPNNYARGLKTNRSYTIGVQIPDILNPYFGDAVKTIQTEAGEKGYSVILYNSDNVIDIEKRNVENILNARVDGIIYVAPRLDLQYLFDTVHIPMVIVDRLPVETEQNVAFVYSDNFAGATMAAEYVIEKGYQEFVYLAGPTKLVTNANERLNGFVDTALRHGIKREDISIYYGEFTFESGRKLMSDYLDTHPHGTRPTVVFGGSDIMAWGAMEALKDRKIKIPRDIAVVGYDNIYFSKYLYPMLTTVENPIKEMAHCSVELLLDAMDNAVELRDRNVLVPGYLKKRISC